LYTGQTDETLKVR